MNNPSRLRQTTLAVAALAAAFSATAPDLARAADKSANKATGTYATGDFHNHTTCSDGTLSIKKLVDKAAGSSAGAGNLDWFVQADHGGSSSRNCTMAEDPFTPVAPALGLTSSSTGPYPPATFPGGGEPASTGKGPNLTWESTLPNGRADILGDGTATPKAMWRWQEIQSFQYTVLEAESRARSKPIWIGLEQNAPGHEHVSTTVLNGQLPWPKTGAGNANLQAQYEYCFDRNDGDTSRGATNLWDCSVQGSANNNASVDATSKKIAVAGNLGGTNSAANPNFGHLKTLEGIRWMSEKAPTGSYFVPAHLERAGVYNPTGSNGFNIEHLRNFNNAGPSIAFGFESMPGHGADASRGSYGTSAVGGGTFGGTGVYAAEVGGVWDALLGEGRNWWFFASSDYHNRGSFGPDQRESTADFFPGEYTRDHVMVRKGGNSLSAEGIIDGLRSGNSFVANGQLIDRLSFTVCAVNPVLPRSANKALLEKAAGMALSKNSDVRIDGCATMGEKLVVRPGADLIVTIALRDPVGNNNAPYSFANPSLKQINVTQPLNAPVLDHVDLITGNVTGYVSPSNLAAYAGAWTINKGTPAAVNPSTKVAKVFDKTGWTAAADGTLTMSYRVAGVKASQYFRLRGSNLPANVPYETDANGNPAKDFDAASNIACSDALCPAHMSLAVAGNKAGLAVGVKTSSFDVAAWSDLWFYSNPVFIEVLNSVKVAGVK